MAAATKSEDKIPVIDLGNLYNVVEIDCEDTKFRDIASHLAKALHEYGFAYLVNHGIPEETVNEAFEQSRNFFELPSDTKMKFGKQLEGEIKNYHGYAKLGQELLNEASLCEIREGFDLMQQNRFYPTQETPKFQPALESLENAGRSLGTKLLTILAMSVELDDANFFCKATRNLLNEEVASLNALRSNYYPSIIGGAEHHVGATRCAPHTDWDIITLLFQDEIGGLEIQRPNDQWTEATPIPNAIVMNVGDLLEAWTGGYFPAVIHRVLVPEAEVRRKTARQSIGYFIFPDDHVVVEPLTSPLLSLVPANKKIYAPTTAPQYFLKKATKAYGI